MNDQSQMMNQMGQLPPPPPPQQMMNPVPVQVQAQIMSQNPVLVQSQAMNQPAQVMMSQNQSQMLSHSQVMNQQQSMMMMMNQQRSYKPWLQQQQQQSSMDPNKMFQNQQNPYMFNKKPKSNNNNGNPNWKGKIVNKDQRRMDKPIPINNNNPALAAGGSGGGHSGAGGYHPPSLNELQNQNRMKARKYYYPKKKYNNRFAPYAPRNTTSFIIRAKKAGGIAELVSPCPVTPAVLPTPIFSPSREVLGDMAKEEWGVDGYGSMKGLIRLRSPGHEAEFHDDEEEEEGNGSSESDVEEHVEVERRLDHDLSRFEMIYPTYGGEYSYNNVLENRVDDQDTHIAQLEEENLTLKERLFLMEQELGDLRRRLQFLERQQGQGQSSNGVLVEDVNEEVVENMSENDENENESDEGLVATATGGEKNEEVMEDVGRNGEGRNINNNVKGEINSVCMLGVVTNELKTGNVFMVKDEVVVKKNEVKDEEIGDEVMAKEDAQGEEVESALKSLIAKEEEQMFRNNNNDDTGKEIVQDKVVVQKDES